jgi:hypothetical protein
MRIVAFPNGWAVVTESSNQICKSLSEATALIKHGSHDQNSHGGGRSSGITFDQSKSINADTMVSIKGGGKLTAAQLVEEHDVPANAFHKVGDYLPSGSIKIGSPFNSDGSQGNATDPHWKSAAWKVQAWGKRVNAREFLS